MEPLQILQLLVHQLCREHAQRKEAQGHKIMQHTPPLPGKGMDSHQHDVAGLGVGKHLAAPDVGVGILQPARKRKEHRRQEGL